MLQITALFQNQNSRIYDALAHWKGNMDKQFEGIESCMICFSVVSEGMGWGQKISHSDYP